MKRIAIAAILITFLSSFVFATQFSPTLLKLKVADVIQYDFDGTELSIPVSVTGTSAQAVFFVYTKDKAESIQNIRNGYLGWHYVNKVDTCIYLSGKTQLTPGQNTITWNGKNNDNIMVPAGEYTYYIWGFDNFNTRQQILPDLMQVHSNVNFMIWQYDAADNPLTTPIAQITNRRWVLGNDPMDSTFIETTGLPSIGLSYSRAYIVFPPDDLGTAFIRANTSSTELKLIKLDYVPNGICVQEPNFEVVWSQLNTYGDTRIDKDYIYCGESNYKETVGRQYIHVIDYHASEGAYETTIDMTDWTYSPGDYEKGGLMNVGNRISNITRNGYYYLNEETSCTKLVFDLNAWKNGDEFGDTVRFINGNGDYIYDHNFEVDSPRPWVCNDVNPAPWSISWPADSNLFSTLTAAGLGAIGFFLIAPDGTGVGNFNLADTTAGGNPGTNIIDSGSAFDGLVVPGAQQDWAETFREDGEPGMFWVGMDSIKGILTSNPVNVESATPLGFSVAQNAPNPFNPTTTINFVLPDAKYVTIDVSNVAGQKVATIANEYMSAGNHSVVWEATGFSASVYFYTVRAGDFSKTMKMTLLK